MFVTLIRYFDTNQNTISAIPLLASNIILVSGPILGTSLQAKCTGTLSVIKVPA